jgi:hypothetical protein
MQGRAMSVRRIRRWTALAAVGGMTVALVAGPPTSPATGEGARARATSALMNVAAPTTPFQQNLQAWPTMAVDPVNTHVLAATANDLVDMQPCSKTAATTGAGCGLPAANPNVGGATNRGVGFSGVYFSFDRGRRWTQPTYQGLTAAGCDPTVDPCTAQPGPIHTVPNYYENGLRTRGGSSVAFGPVFRNGKFSWANGSRMYLSTVAGNLTNSALEPGRLDSSRAVMVSHIDNPTPTRVADQSNWSNPVIVPERTPAVSLPTGDQVWADNPSSSRYFGNVYMCYNDFLYPAIPGTVGPIQPTVGVSGDGGQTWKTHGVAPPVNSASEGHRLFCTIRTDSRGVVYAFFTHFSGSFPSFEPAGAQSIMKSFDGGATWTEPVDFLPMNTACYYADTVGDRCTGEGPAGSAHEPQPSVSIANGAPTGADATDEIVFAWTDGRFGQNREVALLTYSRDRGRSWSAPAKVSRPGERVLYTSVAIAPDASRVYVTYNAFSTPFSTTTSKPRLMYGVLRSAAVGRGGAPVGWTTSYVSPSGDARGTSLGVWNYPEFLGFGVSAIATRRYGAGAWTDVSRTANCPAIDAWRQASFEADSVLTPAPWPLADCPANFGNSDIVSATTAR